MAMASTEALPTNTKGAVLKAMLACVSLDPWGNMQYFISTSIIIMFLGNVLWTHMVGGTFVVAWSTSMLGCVLDHLVGSCWNSHVWSITLDW